MEYVVFYLFAAVSVAAAVLVVVQQKTVYSALALIVCLGAMAGLFFQLGSQFIAAIQVIVYAGAIMVLFVFVIMLIDPETESYPGGSLRRISFWAIPLAVLLVFLLIQAFPDFLGSAAGTSAASVQPEGSVENIARALFTEYVIPFEVTSILILVAILGAIVLARRSD
ncbi:MAG: NADH-quinone oxidoreductase subunit J [Acidobacteriota bacterium]